MDQDAELLGNTDDDLYRRSRLPRPAHVGDAHATAIETELVRFARAVDAGDDGQAIGYLKCLLEAVAKVVHDLNGTPVGSTSSFDSVVKSAHDLLATQPGHELTHATPFGTLASSARKMAVAMSTIRNSYGSGHGRARQPELQGEMLDLAQDASLLWTRWALRRLGYFAQGRPETLIRDLVGDPYGAITFYSGDLASRLAAADLPTMEEKHSRAIGVAVGQRAARDTFNVRIDGVNVLMDNDDLLKWPASYRAGVANGLLFGPDELPTITAHNLYQALRAWVPVIDGAAELSTLLNRVRSARPPGSLSGGGDDHATLQWFVTQTSAHRPPQEQAAWRALDSHLRGTPE